MKNRPLLVPVTLDILLTGAPDIEKPLADFAPKYYMLDESCLLGDQITGSGFSTQSGLPGAHLHWTMPDALLHGTQEENGEIRFPELPNRWLIVRFQESSSRIQPKAWLVQSDAVTFAHARTDGGMRKTAIPYLCYDEARKLWMPAGKGGAYYAFLGEVKPLDDASPEPPGEAAPLERLTAVGMGDHLFSAFYPMCQTVFGFYDPLDGAREGDYTYLVCGYYSKDGSDPLCGADPQAAAQALGWAWEHEGDAPDSVLCHGAACGVHWQGKNHCYMERRGLPLELVIANTSSEALACYLQKQMPEVPGAERMLNALMSGLLEEFDNAALSDPIVSLEERLHERQFGHAHAGENWRLSGRAGNLAQNALGTDAEQAVRDLQALAEKRNSTRQRKASYGEEAWYYWHRYVKRVTSPFSQEGAEDEKARLEESLAAFEAEAQKEAVYSAQLETQVKTVTEQLHGSQLELVCAPAGSFSRPNPPVLLMAEPEADRVYRQGFQTDENHVLPCRLDAAGTLTVPLPEGAVTLSADDVLPLCGALPQSIPVPVPVRALCLETVLLGTPFAHILACAALQKAGAADPGPRLDETAGLVRSAQAAAGGRPFGIALRDWEMPWNPLLLEWQVKLTPARTGSGDNPFDAFTLGEIDLETADTAFHGKEILVSGQTLLTPHAPLLLKQMVQRLAEDFGEGSTEYQQLNELAQKLQDRQILSQQLTGFDDALLGLRYAPALPPLAVPGVAGMEALAARMQPVMDQIYPATRLGMDPWGYLPIRGGTLRLDRFRLIDTFGQFREVNVSEYHLSVGESLRCDTPQTALLPPRFPGGLLFDYHWVSAEDSSQRSLGSASSPVCGFLLVNVFDHSLQVHDADGQFLGWLRETDECVQWRSAPGTTLSPDDIPGTQLRLFTAAALGWERQRFEALLKQADRYFSKSTGAESAENPAFRMGSILAMVRAAFSILEEGRHKLFWGGSVPDTGGYENQLFTLRLGDERRSQDGVAGFFVDKNGKEAYETLYLPSGDNGMLPLTLEDSARTVTLLLDPCREVTLRTGFLPAFHARLSPELYAEQTGRMKPFLDLWPVLSPAENLALPIVESAGRKLTVTQVQRDGAVSVQTLREGLSPLLTSARPRIIEGYLQAEENSQEMEEAIYE